MDPHLCVDVGYKAHRVGIARPDGSILEEFDISHNQAGFEEFFRRVEKRRGQLEIPVAVIGVKPCLLLQEARFAPKTCCTAVTETRFALQPQVAF